MWQYSSKTSSFLSSKSASPSLEEFDNRFVSRKMTSLNEDVSESVAAMEKEDGTERRRRSIKFSDGKFFARLILLIG